MYCTILLWCILLHFSHWRLTNNNEAFTQSSDTLDIQLPNSGKKNNVVTFLVGSEYVYSKKCSYDFVLINIIYYHYIRHRIPVWVVFLAVHFVLPLIHEFQHSYMQRTWFFLNCFQDYTWVCLIPFVDLATFNHVEQSIIDTFCWHIWDGNHFDIYIYVYKIVLYIIHTVNTIKRAFVPNLAFSTVGIRLYCSIRCI